MSKRLPKEFEEGNLDFKKFWMSPDGKIYGVKYEWSHPMWAAEYLKHHGIKYTHAPDELYKRGWVRIITGFEGMTYTLWYETRFKPISSKLKHQVRDLAIELRVMQMKDREGNNQEFLPEQRTISKSVLKQVIKAIILEVAQKDLTQRHPNNPAYFNKNRTDGIGGWDVSKLTLDNLAALKRKIRDSIKFLQANPSEQNAEWLRIELEQFQNVNLEIKNRLAYINKSPLKETEQRANIKSKHFEIRFGESGVGEEVGKIFFGDKWFANALQIQHDWIPGHNEEWVINRSVESFRMGFPSSVEFFETLEQLLEFLDNWYENDYTGDIAERVSPANNQIGSQSNCTGTSHGSSNDYADVQLTRDQLNDPLLNGKLHENELKYRFVDYPHSARADGFGMATDVYYGTVFLGIIVSQEDGYIVSLVKGPEIWSSYRQDPKKPFKTKEDAAQALHRAWKTLRHGETKSL